MADDRIQFNDPEFRLSRYLDGELDAGESRRLEQEIKNDAELGRLLDSYRRMDQSVRNGAGPAPEPDWDRFRQQVLWRCGVAHAARPYRALYRVVVPLAAAAAVVLAFTLYMRSSPRFAPNAPIQVAEVKSSAAAPAAKTAQEAAIINVVFNRTPPQSASDDVEADSDESEEAGSYVIAAAGASPFDDAAANEESAPTF